MLDLSSLKRSSSTFRITISRIKVAFTDNVVAEHFVRR